MTPTQRFYNYLQPILAATPGVATVTFSDGNRLDRLVESTVSREMYPACFFIRPKYQGHDENNGTLWARFSTIVYLFEKAALSDYAEQDAAYERCEAMVTSITQRLYHEAKLYRCLFDLNAFHAEPVEYQLLDSAWGYEVRLQIALPANDLWC